jgi:pseudouridine synthase
VGRLDLDSEGLLLLTNDGDMVHALTHPRFGIKKTYLVSVDRRIEQRHQALMTGEGVVSGDQRLRAGRIVFLDPEKADGGNWYEIDLYEGKNRQIRRMMESSGYSVIRLRRIQFGVIKLRELACGVWRELASREVHGLLNLGYQSA